MITIARLEGDHARWVGLGQGDFSIAHSGGHPRAPLECWLGKLIQVRLAIQGAVGHPRSGAIRGLSLIAVGLDHLAKR